MRVFLDTNIVYKLYRAYMINQGKLGFSSIKDSGHELIVSESIIGELEIVCQRPKTEVLINYIPQFLHYMNIGIVRSLPKDSSYSIYVLDIKDIHVVQDAHSCKAKAILTHNIKDFVVAKILQDLGIKIVMLLDQL